MKEAECLAKCGKFARAINEYDSDCAGDGPLAHVCWDELVQISENTEDGEGAADAEIAMLFKINYDIGNVEER